MEISRTCEKDGNSEGQEPQELKGKNEDLIKMGVDP